MRRIAMLLGAAGIIVLGLAGTPAQAYDGGWGYHNWREQAWREHQWREWAWRRHHYWHPYQYGYYSAPRSYYGYGLR